MPLIISVVGYSNSGKTALLVKMIHLLKSRGYSVGVVKHTEHDFSMDQPGKDTYQLRQAGADGVVLAGPGQIGFLGTRKEAKALDLEGIEQSFFPGLDIVLTEGFKKGIQPKIVVLTEGQEEPLLKEIEGSITATVGEKPVRADWPHFKRDDPEGLVAFLEDRFLRRRERPFIRVALDGKNIPMNHFVQEIIRSSILGLLSPLKGYKDSRMVEIKINLSDR
jgi:molybdopterin-guanine dinucleotide biosynthesis adapter protein